LTLATDSGTDLKIQLPAEVRVWRVPPGSKDLKEATAMQLGELQPGDRILVRGKPGEETGSLVASSIVVMKKEDLSEKQAREQQEWQRHGIGGLVSSVDAAQNSITIKTRTAAGTKDVLIRAGRTTILRRYPPGSVNFDEAKVAPLSEIKVGDQLQARGAKNADGSELKADEVVSGSFQNIAGTISAVNVASSTLTIFDLATKKSMELKVTPASQMRKLPAPMAQRIAMRLKGNGTEANGSAAPVSQPGAPPRVAAGQGAAPNGGAMGGPPRNGGGAHLHWRLPRPTRAGLCPCRFSRRGADPLSSRQGGGEPVNSLSDFQKGDAVMIVAAAGQMDGPSTAIVLLGGVEPILQASSQGQGTSVLTPWSLSQGGGGDVSTP
jgi:hypothetical protein